MYRLIYISRATRFFSNADISSLGIVCRRNNVNAGLTGLLVYHDGRFFQVLEGEEDNLSPVMKRIVRDPRHTALDLIEHGPVQSRAFPTWKMGFVPPEDLAHLPSASLALQQLIPLDSDFRGRDPEVRRHVRAFLASFQSLPRVAKG